MAVSAGRRGEEMLFGRSNTRPLCRNADVGSFLRNMFLSPAVVFVRAGVTSLLLFLPFQKSLLGWSILAHPSSFVALFSIDDASLAAFISPPLCCTSLVRKCEIHVNDAIRGKPFLIVTLLKKWPKSFFYFFFDKNEFLS